MNEYETPVPEPVAEGTAAVAWSIGAPPAQTGRRRPTKVLAAVGLVVALVAGLLAYQFTRPKDTAAAALSFAFRQDMTTRYHVHMTMDGSVEGASAGVGSQPISVAFDETFSWRVLSVDPDGVATIEVKIESLSGSANGQPIPTGTSGLTTKIRIAPDGRVLSAGDLALSPTVGSGGTSIPGMGQMTPILPDHPVAPGDTWQKDFSQAFPFGSGDIHYSTSNRFDRYEGIDGTKAAVITSEISMPLDFSIDMGKLLQAYPGKLDESDQPAAEQLAGATITYGGHATMQLTSWVDLASKQLLKTQSRGNFDMTMGFSGIPSVPAGTELGFKGNMSMDLERA